MGGVDRSTQLDRSPTYQSSLLPGLATKWDSAVPPSLLGLGCFVVASGGKSSAAASGRLVNDCKGTGAASTPCTCCYAVITLIAGLYQVVLEPSSITSQLHVAAQPT